MIVAGIDGGSRAIKIVLLDAGTRQVLARGECDQGIHHDTLATGLFDHLLSEHNIRREDVKRIIATGYTRNGIHLADTTITEITCHAVGVHHLHPDARSVIEIGGQDSKLLRLDADGTVRDFSMNDRCAAGTGRFLEVVAARLGTTLELLGDLASLSDSPAIISSTCVVFAETEIISLLSAGTPPQDIAAGVQNAMASRLAAMAGRQLTPPVVFTGGVARVSGMKQAMESALSHEVQIVSSPQFTGALGAAILAGRQAGK